jgi:Trk-type K+ transport system membrane component
VRNLKVTRKDGAVEKTRTSTEFPPQRPQRCASTNSATTAIIYYYGILGKIARGFMKKFHKILLSMSLAALNNVGSSFGDIVGPKGFWDDLHPCAKWILIMGMIMGRLEYITFVILFKRTFWRD